MKALTATQVEALDAIRAVSAARSVARQQARSALTAEEARHLETTEAIRARRDETTLALARCVDEAARMGVPRADIARAAGLSRQRLHQIRRLAGEAARAAERRAT